MIPLTEKKNDEVWKKEEVNWNMFSGLSINFHGRRRPQRQKQQKRNDSSIANGNGVTRNDDKDGSKTLRRKNTKNSRGQAEKKDRNLAKSKQPNQPFVTTASSPQPKEKKKEWKIFRLRGSRSEEEKRERKSSTSSTDNDSTFSNPETSKQRNAIYRTFGGSSIESIQVEQQNEPVAPEGNDHVVVRILASTVSIQDCLLRRGLDFEITNPISLPAIPGQDFVGRIVNGNGATELPDGTLVAGLVRTGGNSRFISVPARTLIEVPGSIRPDEAVCMVSAYATAYQCMKLVSHQNLLFALEGKKVLIIGCMDNVGQALIDMCKTANAEVLVTAPEHRHSYVKSLCVKPLPEMASEWLPLVQREMDIVFDGLNQSATSETMQSLKRYGSLVCFGQSSLLKQKMGLFGAPISAHFGRMEASIFGTAKIVDLWSSYRHDPETYKKNIQILFQYLISKKIKPNITNRIRIDEVGLWHHKLETGEARGMIVCLPWKRISKQNIFRVNADSICRKAKNEPISSA